MNELDAEVRPGRFMWWAPQGVTQWWVPRMFRGGDEFGNPSLAFVVPPFGCFIFFYGRTLRTEPFPDCNDGEACR